MGLCCVYLGIYPSVQTYTRYIQVCMKASQEIPSLPNVLKHKDNDYIGNVLCRSRIS